MSYSWMLRLTFCLLLFTLTGCSESTVGTTDVVESDDTKMVATAGVEAVENEAAGNDTVEHETVEASAAESKTETSAEPMVLTIGDTAPDLRIANWFRGSQVDGFEDDHVYVVEFWATWCGPCKVGMPHISELQSEMEDDVTFIGVTREDLETVEEFFASEQSEGKIWDDIVKYTIAIDDDGITDNSYMKAARQNGIPCAFIVGKDGHVEWIGHPATIDEPLRDVVDGSWDRNVFAKGYAEAQQRQVAMSKMRRKLQPLMVSEEWDEAIKVAEDFAAEFPDDSEAQMLKVQVLMSADRGPEAVGELNKIAKSRWDDPQGLNEIAWIMATRVPEEIRDLDSALESADRALELDSEDASILDTVARVHFERGDLDKAIEYQEKAAAKNPQFQSNLDDYIAERDGGSGDAEEADEDEEEDSDEEDSDSEEGTDES